MMVSSGVNRYHTVFEYRCYYNGSDVSEIIDIEDIDQEDAINGFYDSLADVHELYGESANMIVAECAFERGLL
jgi:glycine/serine hydroxymethyltransferase